MSLKDTIRGAREEAAASGNPFERTKKDDTEKAAKTTARKDQRYTRRSMARAKPSREAAAGVTVVSASKGKAEDQMSKEERKEKKRKDREVEDRRYNVTQILLEENPEYHKTRKMWWAFLIVGVVFMAVALALYGTVNSGNPSATPWMAGAAVVCMVLAYASVIGGLIFDYIKMRPLRKDADMRARSMSDKRLKALLVANAEKKEAEKAARSKKR